MFDYDHEDICRLVEVTVHLDADKLLTANLCSIAAGENNVEASTSANTSGFHTLEKTTILRNCPTDDRGGTFTNLL